MMLLSLSAVTSASAATPGSASAATPGPAEAAVPQGITAAGLHATPVFPVAGKTKETVSFVLKERNQAALQAKVNAGIHGRFLSVAQFASRYGQPSARIRSLEAYLHRYGLKSSAYSDDLVITASGTASEFNKALSVSQHQYAVKAVPARAGHAARPAFTFHGTTDRPLLPRNIAWFVQSIMGLTNYPVFTSNAVRALSVAPASAPAGLNTGNRTPANFARQYGLTPLYGKGAKGQGQTIGIITFASVRPADATHFWSSILKIRTKKNRITLDKVDSGSGPVGYGRGSGETTLDVEQSGAVAPQASIIVYQAPNTDYGNIDAYAAAASQNKAETVSCSWGESETIIKVVAAAGQESSGLIQANDELFLELAAQGQSSFSTSGDSGAYDATGDLGSTNVAVDNAGDSPWTTTGGGTTLAGNTPLDSQVNVNAPPVYVHIAAQRAWGWDWLWPHWSIFLNGKVPFTSEDQFIASGLAIGGSGGGYSLDETRPGYQKQIPNIGKFSAVPYLTPWGYKQLPGTSINEPSIWKYWNAVSGSAIPPATVTGVANGRATPDLATDADPNTGYEEYFSGFPAGNGGPTLETGWGGTSFVAPQLNGSAAVIDSYLGHRVGFWNPFIYKFATTHNSPFQPEDAATASNDNLYYTGTQGHLWNPGTGLGTPNLAKLAADFRGEF
jgi:kumamolisin